MAFDPRASKVRLVVLDVDGVLSDGSIVFSNEGELFKAFNVRDGLGIKLLQRAGIEVAILTGRTSGIVARRAEELGMKRIEQGKLRKLPTLLKMLDELNISAEELAYMGDDLPDLPCLRIAGFAATPKNGNVKHLHCGTCGAHWKFERIRCAACGTSAVSDLSYVHDEADPARRLHVCKACGAATPTFFASGDAESFSPEVERLRLTGLEAAYEESRAQ